MAELSNTQSDALSTLAIKTEKSRKLERQIRALKKECELIMEELNGIAKENKHKLSNGEHAVTFKTRKGGDYHIKKWRKYGVDTIITL